MWEVGKRPALQKEPSFPIAEQRQPKTHAFRGAAPRAEWEVLDTAASACRAMGAKRALGTARRARQADGLSQLHECLIPVAGVLAGEKSLGEGVYLLRTGQTPEAGEHARDVAVDRGVGEVVSDR